MRYPDSGGNQTEYLPHGGSFNQACKAGELDIVKAMVERTQADMEARDWSDWTHCTGRQTMVTSMWCCSCASRALTRRRGIGWAGHHCTWQHSMIALLWCCTSKGWSDGMRNEPLPLLTDSWMDRDMILFVIVIGVFRVHDITNTIRHVILYTNYICVFKNTRLSAREPPLPLQKMQD